MGSTPRARTGPPNRPKPFPRPSQRGNPPGPPSVPVPDRAWGWEYDEDGVLRLQQPDGPTGPESVGPGLYSPTDFTMRQLPPHDFGKASGRKHPPVVVGAVSADAHTVRTELAPGEYEGATINPIPRLPMPTAAFAQRCPRPQRSLPANVRPDPVSPPGPGSHATPRGIGSTQPVPAFPRQSRFFARVGEDASPLAGQASPRDGARGGGRGGRGGRGPALSDLSSSLAVGKVTLSPAVRVSPVLPSELPKLSPDAADPRTDGRSRRSSQQQAAVRADGRAALPPYPEGLDRRGRRLWRIFCSADVDGTGQISKRELFTALQRSGAFRRNGAAHEGASSKLFTAADTNYNGTLSWEEFVLAALDFDEIVDLSESPLGPV